MGIFKGTKGKWEYKKDGFNFIVETNDGIDNWLILRTISNYPQDEANAKLISCAPEMLEFIQSLINESDDIVHEEIKKQANQLIKKATDL